VRQRTHVDARPAEDDGDSDFMTVPDVPPAADLARPPLRRSWVVICFCLSLLVYLAMVPRVILYSNPPTGDQAFYLMVIASIVQDGDLNIANNYAQRDEDKFYSLSPRPPGFVGMGAPYPLPMAPTASSARPPEERYDHRMPGLPLLLAPAWAVGSWLNLWWPATIIAMCVFGAMLVTNIFLFAYELTGRKWIAWAVWLPAAFSNPIMTYVLLVFTEVVAGLLIIYAFRRLALGWTANGPWRMLLVGLCIGYIPWLSWRNFPISVALGAYGLYQFWRYARTKTQPEASTDGREQGGPGLPRNLLAAVRKQALPLAMWLAPMIVAAVLLTIWNLFLYGSLTPPSRVPELGDSPPFLWPWQGGEQFTRWVTVGFALLLDRQTGLFVYAPFYLLSLVGIVAMFKSRRSADRRLLLWMAAVTLPYLAIIMSFVFWSGLWGPPARYVSAAVPLLFCGPLAISLLALERSKVYKVLYGLLALPGLGIMVIMLNDARYLWPGNPIFLWLRDNPASPLKIDLWNSLPSIEHLDSLRLPANTGWMTVVGTLIVLGSLLLMLRRPRWSDNGLPLAVQGLITLGILGVVGGAWFLMNAEYLKPRTLLTQQNRWRIDMETGGPQGIAYLDNKVFFADFQGSFLGALDLSSGTFSVVQPITASQAVSITRPTDVAVGPDNMLYVLNNGEGEGSPGVLVIKSDGTLVRAVTLEGRSSVASGIAVESDGSIWVADTVGGRVLKYGPEGGAPVLGIVGSKFECVNIIDVAVLSDGSVFITDQSHRVLHVSSDGELLNTYKTQFNPWYLATNGDWVDATYDQGMISVNVKSNQPQQARVAGPGEQLAAPRGITYGPDGTLYVLDAATSSIAAYQVQH
jgi:DNA-binding beta-propeller fold protein YncE